MVQSFGFQISKEKRMPTFRFVGESKITFVNLVVQCLTNSSYAITSGEIDGETVETLSDFIFLGSKITADGGCSHEIKRCLLLWKESYDQPK